MRSANTLLIATARHARSLAIVAALVSPALAGCSSFDFFNEKKELTALPDEPADKLYNEALFEMNSRKYDEAVKKFTEVDKQHPYSEFARKSVMMTAYIKYSQGEYEEAISNAKRYLALHPGSQDAAYAQYIVGMSYFNQIPDITRDQERTARALQALEEVVRKYPKSEYADAARQRMEIARDQLAGKEMDIGRYYLKQRNYTGAVNRFRVVITNYQRTRHIEEALARVAEAYMAMGIVNEAQTAAAVLGHNFPDSQWYKDTYNLVTTDGSAPREDTGSWISKAFKKVGLG